MSIGKMKSELPNQILNLKTRIQEEKKAIAKLELELKQRKIFLTRQEEALLSKERELQFNIDKKRRSLLWRSLNYY